MFGGMLRHFRGYRVSVSKKKGSLSHPLSSFFPCLSCDNTFSANESISTQIIHADGYIS